MRRRGAQCAAGYNGWREYAGIPTDAPSLLVVGMVSGALWVATARGQCPPAGIELVSKASNGDQAEGRSELPAVSADGCVIAFKSNAPNLVPGAGNDRVDVFRRDRNNGQTIRVPVTANSRIDPNGDSFPPALDGTGNLVAFASAATNLVAGDFNIARDLFVYDIDRAATAALTLRNEGLGGGLVPPLAPSVSRDGCVVAFSSTADLTSNDGNQLSDAFVHVADPATGCDHSSGTTELLSVLTFGSQAGSSPADGRSIGVAVSGDGCVVAFYSDAHLVMGGSTGICDVLVRNRCSDPEAPLELIGQVSNGSCSETPQFLPAISGDGRFVAFGTDVNVDGGNIYVRDRQSATTLRVSNNVNGDVPNAPSQYPSLSSDGRFVVFQSTATDLVDPPANGKSQIFVVDTADASLRAAEISVGSDGEGDADSIAPQMSADGGTIVFQSSADNLVTGDSNGDADIFAVGNPLNVPVTPETPTSTETPGLTETPTATFTLPSATPTSQPTSTPTLSPTPTTSTVPSATPTASLTVTEHPLASPTPVPTSPGPETATSTPTSATPTPTGGSSVITPASHNGGGGGCSCRIDGAPDTSTFADTALALVLPLLLLARGGWRRSRQAP